MRSRLRKDWRVGKGRSEEKTERLKSRRKHGCMFFGFVSYLLVYLAMAEHRVI